MTQVFVPQSGRGAGRFSCWHQSGVFSTVFTLLIVQNSLTRYENALVDVHGAAGAPGTVFQFERVGYFCVDPDSKPGRVQFILVVY